MNFSLIQSKLARTLRCIVCIVILFGSFPNEITLAKKVDRTTKIPTVPVATLSSLPVVSITNGGEQLCSGVLVTSKTVLTSRDCLGILRHRDHKSRLAAKVGTEQSSVSKLISSRKLQVGLVKLAHAIRQTKPTKLHAISRMAFGKDFVVAGFGKDLDGEIGYLNALYMGGDPAEIPKAVSCFGDSGMPALVRRPTAVVGVATYGFGECFFDSEVTFQNVGASDVSKMIKNHLDNGTPVRS